ncbi:DUF3318 domain-containing protein [Synechococcus sp. PCC 7336]|uniref:DUF3318 domain-containing protein n=1 Tax=Synechococcus sp. PCC 7336 TaxID=195250 RepID=UPI00056F48DC|nr:DUF3318 domain-containing protein [Synechococcus sp. PCC 7336]
MAYSASISNPQEEIQRLRDLLPASLRPLLAIAPMPYGTIASDPNRQLIGIKPRPPWQPTGTIQIQFSQWLNIPQAQRDLLFLREAGWFDSRAWLQPGLYQIVAAAGGLATVLELALHNPVSVLLAGGVTGLAVRQVWQNLHSDNAQFNADEFALRRAQYRGYERREAARHLLAALETAMQVDQTDVLTILRLQRLKAIATS